MRLELIQRHYVPAAPLPCVASLGGLTAVIDAFETLEAWDERYQYIIDIGQAMSKLPEEFRTEDHRLHGCQSQVWLVITQQGGALFIHAASDAAIVNGLLALVTQVYSGRTPAEILAQSPDFLTELGLGNHLSPLRKNGLFALVEAVQSVAAHVKAQEAA